VHFLKDGVNRLRPHERARVLVVAMQIIAQTLPQLRHRGEHATTESEMNAVSEGRVYPYKDHAVRRNVAATHGEHALGSWSPGDDLWELIFERADRTARNAGESDLVSHWIAEGDSRIERHVPLLLRATEVAAFERVKRQLAAYRVVFGQPRQEELISLLDRADLPLDTLQALTLDLSPPKAVDSAYESP